MNCDASFGGDWWMLNRGEDEGNSEGEIRFTRTILPSDASEYRIDGRKVPEKEYQAKLKSVGLLVKSRNFLVFQNEVEKVAQKSPKELTELIERISGSEVSPVVLGLVPSCRLFRAPCSAEKTDVSHYRFDLPLRDA
jgi:hypothetical protein